MCMRVAHEKPRVQRGRARSVGLPCQAMYVSVRAMTAVIGIANVYCKVARKIMLLLSARFGVIKSEKARSTFCAHMCAKTMYAMVARCMHAYQVCIFACM